MPIVAPNEGLLVHLDHLLRAAISGMEPWDLFLWANDVEPVQATVFADLTEATFYGYSRVTLARPNWTYPVIIADRAVSTYTMEPQTWICSGSPETIYGYGIVGQLTEKLYFVERFATPQELIVHRLLGVLPRVTLTTELIE